MTPEADILEHLSAFGQIPLADALRQVPARLTCLRTIDDLRQRGRLTICTTTDHEERPLELWRWREMLRDPKILDRDSNVVLKKTADGVQEWWRLYEQEP